MPTRVVAALTAAALLAAGCLSHEYRISRPELERLAQLPPEARGQRVRVVQLLGERRADAVPPEPAPPPPEVHGDLNVQIGFGGHYSSGYRSGGPAPRAVHSAAPVGGGPS